MGLPDRARVDKKGACHALLVRDVRVAKDQSLCPGNLGDALEGGLRTIFIQVFVHLARAAMYKQHLRRPFIQTDRWLQLTQEALVLGGGMLSAPQQRMVPQLGRSLILVSAAAILEIESYALVIVPHDRRDLARLEELHHLVREGTVSDQVAQAVDRVGLSLLEICPHGFKRVDIGMHVGKYRHLHR